MNRRSNPQLRMRRREFLRFAGLAGVAALAAACGQAATSTPEPKAASKQDAPAAGKAPVQSASGTAEWDNVVEGAKREGQVVVTTLAGDGYRKVLDKFHEAYPASK